MRGEPVGVDQPGYRDGRAQIDDPELARIDDEPGEGDAGQDDALYEFYERWFAAGPLRALLDRVRGAHEEIWLHFLIELQSAVSLLYESVDENARVAGYLRGYRAIDFYDAALRHAIVVAFAEPFADLFSKPIEPRRFFQREVLNGIHARALDGVFGDADVRNAIASFFGKHRDVRNLVVHRTLIPTHDELRAMLLDAKAVYDLADRRLYPDVSRGSHVPILDVTAYAHDNYKPPDTFGLAETAPPPNHPAE